MLDGVPVLVGHDQRDQQRAELALQLRDQLLGVPGDEVADRAVERVRLVDALLAAARRRRGALGVGVVAAGYRLERLPAAYRGIGGGPVPFDVFQRELDG